MKIKLFMPCCIGDGQEGQEVAKESDNGIDYAPNSSKSFQRIIDFWSTTIQ